MQTQQVNLIRLFTCVEVLLFFLIWLHFAPLSRQQTTSVHCMLLFLTLSLMALCGTTEVCDYHNAA